MEMKNEMYADLRRLCKSEDSLGVVSDLSDLAYFLDREGLDGFGDTIRKAMWLIVQLEGRDG